MPAVLEFFLELFLPSIDQCMWFLLIWTSLTDLQTQRSITQKNYVPFPKGSYLTGD